MSKLKYKRFWDFLFWWVWIVSSSRRQGMEPHESKWKSPNHCVVWFTRKTLRNWVLTSMLPCNEEFPRGAASSGFRCCESNSLHESRVLYNIGWTQNCIRLVLLRRKISSELKFKMRRKSSKSTGSSFNRFSCSPFNNQRSIIAAQLVIIMLCWTHAYKMSSH